MKVLPIFIIKMIQDKYNIMVNNKKATNEIIAVAEGIRYIRPAFLP
jgi:hypothetical protein